MRQIIIGCVSKKEHLALTAMVVYLQAEVVKNISKSKKVHLGAACRDALKELKANLGKSVEQDYDTE